MAANPRRYSTTATTNSSGAATVYLPATAGESLSGEVVNVIYTKTDFANGVDFTITLEATGQTVWTESDVNASKTVAPRQASHSTAGVAAVYAAAGEAVAVPIVAAGDRLKIVIASGGDTKTGAFTVVVQ